MSFEDSIRSMPEVAQNARDVVGQGLRSLKRDIAVLIYPLFAFLIVLATLASVNSWLEAAADSVAQDSVFAAERQMISLLFGILAFIVFYLYLAIMTGLFTSVVAASIMAEMDGHPTPLLKGLKTVVTRFGRVASFSALAILLIPLALLAQRKSPKRTVDMLGGAFGINMASLTPAVLTQNSGVFNTIRLSIDTLGQAWKENILIKAAMYGLIILIGALSFLPNLAQGHWVDQETSGLARWLLQVLLFLSLLIASRVLIGVFTATLYWRITNNKH